MNHSGIHILCLLILSSWTFSEISGQQILRQKVMKKAIITNEQSINSPNMESSPCFAGDKIVYVFTGPKGKIWDTQTGDAFFDLGFAKVHEENSLSEKGMFDNNINSPYHEGPACYHDAENMLYFTRTFKEKKGPGSGASDTFYLRIMTASLNQAKAEVRPLPLVAHAYSVCHPTINSSGKTLIFSSNQAGGIGKMDLYAAYFDGTEWGGVISLGNAINSPYNEIFPTLVNDSLLFFTSDRPGGVGGLDLYVSRLEQGIWSAPEVLAPPFNSPYDDLSFIVRSNGRSGYFASNRPGGLGKDDIYSWETKESILPLGEAEAVDVHFFTLDKLSLDPVPNAEIRITSLTSDLNQFTLSEYNLQLLDGDSGGELILRLFPQKSKEQKILSVDQDGKSSTRLSAQRQYLISIQKDGYAETRMLYDRQVVGDTVHILMEPSEADQQLNSENSEEAEEANDELVEAEGGTVLVMDQIYYDYNSSSIVPGAAHELDTLAAWLRAHATKRIRLVSHTDSRGSSAYNMQLSIDRAGAARTYLSEAGIDEQRIEIRGMGENALRNQCKNGVACTEKQHRFNRRTEVVLLDASSLDE
jgi:outer membrane protein OmpA-like peptidoglycan-associated protein